MLNIVWPIFIIISFSYAIFSGNLENLNSSIFQSTQDAINLSINLLGTICLWNGIMQIANEIIIGQWFVSAIIGNILGLGNAATPLGLRAMNSMQEINETKDELSNSMVVFIVLNTASIQIIPTTVIAIRNSLNSNNPTAIIVPVWIATICAAIMALSCAKMIIKFQKNNK